MNALYRRLFAGWNLMRIIRLGLGLWVLVMSIQSRDTTMGLFSAFFVVTAIFGVGCCGASGCYVAPGKTALKGTDDIDYEEIK